MKLCGINIMDRMRLLIFDTALKQGGIVFWDGEIKWIKERSALSLQDLHELFCLPDVIVAEEVQLFSAGKAALAAKYQAKGQLEAFAAVCGKEIQWVPAKKWQKALGFAKDGRTDYQWKKYLWEQAQQFYPCTKESADAVLITRFIVEHSA